MWYFTYVKYTWGIIFIKNVHSALGLWISNVPAHSHCDVYKSLTLGGITGFKYISRVLIVPEIWGNKIQKQEQSPGTGRYK